MRFEKGGICDRLNYFMCAVSKQTKSSITVRRGRNELQLIRRLIYLTLNE